MKSPLFLTLAFAIITTVSYGQTEICNNGLDDDFDGFIDCYDGSCSNDPSCDGIFLGNDASCSVPPPQFPQFTMTLDFASPNETTNHLSRMAIGDLDRDGMPELISMNRYTKKIFILNGNDGSIKSQATVTWEPQWEVAIANLDDDSCGEIFFIGYQNPPGPSNDGIYLFAYDCNLNFLWQTAERLRGDPINYGLADFDGDGLVELYAKDEIYDAKTGVRIVKSTAASYGRINGGPVAADISGDSKLELIIGLGIYQVNLASRTLDAGSLTLLSSRPEYFVRNEYNATSVADFNQDGFLDIIASGSEVSNNNTTTIFYWDVQNNVVKTYRDLTSGYGPNGWANGTGRVNIADLDGDGSLNASYVSGKYLYALKEDLTLLWRIVINEETSGYTGCTLFDFNGDGKSEIVYRDEQFLYIIDGTDGSVYNQKACVSRTNREYPIVADVDADGSTELCVTCGFDDVLAKTNFNNLGFSRYSHIRVFKSAAEPWVPARRVWNQHGYFVVNINDDLTVPKVLQKHQLVFSTGNCTQGPNRPLNKFLNQSPFLNSEGCPTYASPDIAFSIAPTVVPPTCPDLNFTVSFQITNLGDVGLSGNIPVTFYTKNPNLPGSTKLNTITIALTTFNPNDLFNVVNATVNGIGSDSLYVVLNDAGTTVPTPISLPNTTFFECNYDNILGVKVIPKPVTITGLAVSPNEKCSPPDNGSARAFIPIGGGGENTADYNFYWSDGAVAKPIVSADFVGPIYSGIAEGTYTVYGIHKTANCSSDTAQVVINAVQSIVPPVTITVLSEQTQCNPPNGKLEAFVTGGNSGYTFEWFDNASSLGVTTSVASGLIGGNYTVFVSRNGCTTSANALVNDNAPDPDVTATSTPIINCQNPNSGTVSATVAIGGLPQPSADYNFVWYFYDNATSTRGSQLPAGNGTGATRTGLAAGFYQIVATNTSSQCPSLPVVVEVQNQTVVPVVTISQVDPQTSCDPANPNGKLLATVTLGGVPQNPADFTFEWFVGQNTTVVHPDVSGTNGSVAEKIKGGGQAYTVRATSAQQCFSTDDGVVTETLNVPVVTLTPSPNSICDPALVNGPAAFQGSVTASVTFAGNPVVDFTNYQFEWYDGTQAIGAKRPETSSVLSSLDNGFYTLVATRTDILCPSTPKTAEVINATPSLVITTNAIGSTNCLPTLANGQAIVTDVDGAGTASPYVFAWHNGSDTSTPIPGATAATLTDLQGAPGAFFTVLVTNQTNGCQNTATVEVPDNKILPLVTLATTPNSICDQSLTNPNVPFNGSVSATVTNQVGAIGNYTFAWTDNETNTAIGAFTGPVLSNRDSSSYSVVTTHVATGCVSTPVNAQILNISTLPALVMDAVGSTNCTTAADGQALVATIDATPVPNTGLLAPYAFEWFTGSTTASVIAGASDGILEGRQGAAGAFFTVRVTDLTNGCRNTGTVEVPDNKILPLVTLATTPNSICDQSLTNPNVPFNGSVTASVTNQVGAIGNYTFAWTDNETNTAIGAFTGPILSNRDSSRYTVVTTHVLTGCVSTPVNAQVLNVTLLPALVMDAVGSTNCTTAADGQALVATIDATPVPNTGVLAPYAFEWFTGSTTASVIAGASDGILEGRQGAAGAFFTVRVTDLTNGCRNTGTVEVPDSKILPLVTLAAAPNSICDQSLTVPFTAFNGSVSATVTNQVGAIGDYTFAWTDNETNTTIGAFTGPVLSNRDSSNYTVVTTHLTTGCVSSPVNAQVLNVTTLPVLVMDAVGSTNCDPLLPNGIGLIASIDTTPVPPTGILSPYAFEWFSGNTTTTVIAGATDGILEGRQGGIGSFFTTRVTDQSNGCQNTAVIEVPDEQSLPVVTLSSTDNENCSAPFNGTASAATITYKGLGEPLAGYSFAWTHGPITSTATALNVGTYELRVTRVDVGCTSNPAQVDVDNNIYIPVINVAITNQTSCDVLTPNGILSATLDETSIGGVVAETAGYTYQWTNDGNPLTPGGPSAGTTSSINALKGNLFYTLSVERTATRCSNTQSVFLPERINLPRLELVASDIVDCNTQGFVTARIFIDKNNDGDSNDAGDELTPAEINSDYTLAWFRGSNTLGTPLAETDGVLNELSPGVDLPAGNYTAIATNNISNCKTADFTDVINGPGALFVLDFEINNQPASCADSDGIITAFVDSGGGVPAPFGNFTFQWFKGNPTNGLDNPTPSFYTDPVIQFVQPALVVDPASDFGNPHPGFPQPQAPTSINTGPTLFGRESGTYSVVVTDNTTGCKEFKTVFLPFLQEPVIILARIKPDECLGNFGEIEVDLSVPAPNNPNQYLLQIYSNSNPVLGTDVPLAVINPASAATNVFANLASGIYTIVARENPALIPTACYSSPVLVQLIEALPPKVDILGSGANSTCVGAPLLGDGSLQIKISTDVNDPFSASYPLPPPPTILQQGVAPFVTYSLEVKDAGNVAIPGYSPNPTAFEDGDTEIINGLRGETYTITVTSSKGCFTTKTFNIPNAPRVADLSGDVTVLPALACDPALEANASIEVKNLAIAGVIASDNLSDYQFDWFTNVTLTASVLAAAPGNNNPLVKGGEVLSNVGAPLPTSPVTAGSYWVRATKVNAGAVGGLGCLSAPFKVDIDDQSVKPTGRLTPLANTSCDTNFEGSVVSLITSAGSMPATLNYTYTWTTPAASPIVNGASNGDGLGIDDVFPGLSDGTYSLLFKNNSSGCEGFIETTVDKSATPIVVTNATPVDQLICNPDGSISVGANDIIVGGVVDNDHTRFDFTWARGDVATVVAAATQSNDLLNITDLPTIGADTYFVKVKKRAGLNPGSGCESAPFRVDILDKSVDPTVTLAALSNTACDTNFEGSIAVTVTSPGSAATPDYDYTWTSPVASPIANATSNGDGLGPDDNFANLSDGIYSISIRNNASGCFGSAQTNITRRATPVIVTNATPLDQLICNPDGSISVGTNDILVGGVVDNDHTRFDFTWSRGAVGTIVVGPTQSKDVIDITDIPTIGAGTYFVSVKKRPGLNPGSGCESAPFRVDILDKSVDPTVTLSSLANTSCDTNFEGSLKVTVTSAGSAATPDYDYTWTSPAASPIVNATSNGDGLGPDDNFANLSDGTYTISIRNNTSGCLGSAQTIINKLSTPIVITNATPIDQLICNPDGSISVGANDIVVGGLVDSDHTRFDFTWARGTVGTIVVGPTQSKDVIDITDIPTIGAGTYFVSVKKRAGLNPGSGCESAPFRVDILDKSVDPTVTLASLANTSCDTNFEGSLKVTVTSAGSAATPDYDYTWTSPAASPIANATSNGDGLGLDDNFANLSDGTYSISIRNNTSGCVGSAQTIINKIPAPIVITNATPIDQLICNPDGSISVGANDILVGGVIDSDHTRFDFTWARGTVGTIVVGPTQSKDLIDISDIPTIGAGTYFVSVKKRAGLNPGSGCESAPFKVEILDKSQDPDVSFTSVVPNSSCTPTSPNGFLQVTASERVGPAGVYSFVWAFNGGALPPSALLGGASPVSDISNAGPGTYLVEVTNTTTGCKFNQARLLETNQTLSLPSIIDIDQVNPTNCLPQGSVQVVSVTIGGNNVFTNPPDDLDTDFDYEWFKGTFPGGLIAGEQNSLLSNQLPGKYFVRVKNLITECVSSNVETVIDSADIVYPVVSIQQIAPQVICTVNVGSGALNALADGQNDTNPNYEFNWFSNLTSTGTSFASTSNINSLLAGDYSLEVHDLTTDCRASAIFILPENKLEFTPVLALSSNPLTECDTNDGSVFARGVLFPINTDPAKNYPFAYDYTADLYVGNPPADLNNPEFPDMPQDPNNPLLTENHVQQNLTNGIYTVRLTDNNTGCFTIDNISVDDLRKFPVPVITTIAPVTNCDPANPNGVARVLVDGNFIGFEFNWFEGSAVAGTPVYTGVEFGELKVTPQTYTVEAINLVTGCTGSAQTTITNGTLPIPSPQIEILSDVTSCIFDNGALAVSVGGVTRDFVFDWYDGSAETPPSDFIGEVYDSLAVGTYSVTATSRITGCKSPLVSQAITDKREFPEFNFQITNASCDLPNGFATISFVSTVGISTIEWFSGNQIIAVGPNLTDVGFGLYSVSITSELGCETSRDLEILADIRPRNGISRNGDSQNDYFHIDCIENFESNNVKIFNRAGTLVYEADGYDNSNIFFNGGSNRGVSLIGTDVPDGTYFFIVDKRDGSKPLAGYLEIVK